MVTTEKRTIEIVARVADVATRPLQTIARSITNLAHGGVRDMGRLVSSVVSFRTAITAVVGGFAALRGGAGIQSIIDSTDELAKLARATNASADRLLVLQQTFQLTDVQADRFRTMMAALTKGVGQALVDNTSRQAKALERLGLSFDELRSKDPVELLDSVAGSLERFGTPQERAAALLEVFPRMTSDVALLVDVLGQGQEQFRNMVATAEFFGGSIDAEGVAAIERMNNALDVTKLALQSVGREATVSLSKQFAPIVERLATWFAQNRERVAEMLAKVLEAVTRIALAMTAVLLRLLAFLSANGEKLVESLQEIPFIGAKVAEGIRKVFDVRNVAPGARAIRDEIEQLADAERGLLDERERRQRFLEQAEQLPGEFSAERLQDLREQLREVEQQRSDFYQRMLALQKKFEAFQQAGGGTPSGPRGEVERQQEGASLRAFAAQIGDLVNFDNLPEPPTNLAPIIKALFGTGGIEAATEKTRGFFAGVDKGLRNTIERWQDFGAAGEEAATSILDGGLNGVVNALSEGALRVKSWNRAWKDLGIEVLSTLTKIIAKLLVMKTLETVGVGAAFERGGVMPGRVERTLPVERFESGGIVKRPTIAIFGEGRARGGEAFVPLPDGRRIPVALTGGGGGTIVNITVQAWDGQDATRAMIAQRGTLRALWQHDIGRIRGVRQGVRAAAR